MRFIKILFVLILFVLFAILYVQNQEVVNHVFRFKLDLPFLKVGPYLVYNILIIGISFIIGALFAAVFGALSSSGKSAELRQKNKRIKELETEVLDLENKLMKKDSGSTSDISAFTSASSNES